MTDSEKSKLVNYFEQNQYKEIANLNQKKLFDYINCLFVYKDNKIYYKKANNLTKQQEEIYYSENFSKVFKLGSMRIQFSWIEAIKKFNITNNDVFTIGESIINEINLKIITKIKE